MTRAPLPLCACCGRPGRFGDDTAKAAYATVRCLPRWADVKGRAR